MKKVVSAIPNILTILRMCIAVTIGILLFVPHSISLVQVLAVIGIISDKLDGTLARLWKVESELGKKLESVADPFFNLIAGIYVITKLDFPLVYFWIVLGMLVTTVIGRILVKIITGKFFYEKSQITRVGTALTFTLVLLYLFAIPYRDWFAAAGCVYGGVVFLNYARMMVRFVQRTKTY